VVVVRNIFGGSEPYGPWEWLTFQVMVISDGRARRIELFEDEASARDRYQQLTGDRVKRLTRLYIERMSDPEHAGLEELYTDDFVAVDHRRVGWEETKGAHGLIAMADSMSELVSDPRIRVEPIDASDGDILTARQTLTGTWQEGAPYEISFLMAIVLRGDRIARIEMFEDNDEHGMNARAAELRSA
jgi:hypothetical protein